MKCCIANCKTTWKPKKNSKTTLSFFRIPTCNKRRRRWVKILENYVDYKLCQKRDNVCEKHFEPSYIQEVKGRKYLTKDAEPTIFESGLLLNQYGGTSYASCSNDSMKEYDEGSDFAMDISYNEHKQSFNSQDDPLFMVFKTSPHSSIDGYSPDMNYPDEISILPELPIIEPKIEPVTVPIKTRQSNNISLSNISVIPEASFTDIEVPEEEPDAKRKPLTGSYFRAMKDLAVNLRQMQRELIEDFFKKQEDLMREEHEFQKRQDELLLSSFEEQTKLLLDGARNLLSSGLSEPPDIVYINED